VVLDESDRKSESARTTTVENFLLLFSRLFYAQGALESTLKLQNVSPRITLTCFAVENGVPDGFAVSVNLWVFEYFVAQDFLGFL